MSREKEDYTWRNRVDKIESWQWNKIRLKYLGTELVRNSNKFKERNRFAMETGKVINKISNRLRRRSKKIQEYIGISGAKGNILNYILVESENHPVYQKEIEEEFGLRPSTATETLKNLEQAGLICRMPESEDGRYKKIVFTEQARKIEHILRKEITESEELLLQGITEEERKEFLRIAEKMLRNLEWEI